MSELTRRGLLSGVAAIALTYGMGVNLAKSVEPDKLHAIRNGEIVEEDARAEIRALTEEIIAAAEKRMGVQISVDDREEWLNESWFISRKILGEHYEFVD